MASARCENCGSPQGLKHTYTHPHEQVSSPSKKGLLCSTRNCTRLALIWLTDDEEQRYLQGVRAFRVRYSGDVQLN
jgi:hypothetical protein